MTDKDLIPTEPIKLEAETVPEIDVLFSLNISFNTPKSSPPEQIKTGNALQSGDTANSD